MAEASLPPREGGELDIDIEVELLSPLDSGEELQVIEEDDPHIGALLDGRYRIESLLAVGGMGRVYRARQESLQRTVVVKILDLPVGASLKDPRFQERFALEAATASRLNHPNSVTIYDFGHTKAGTYFIVMEHVDGIALHRILRAERRMEPVRALFLTRQVCRALREAHAHHIVHRDLKPSNILIVHQGDEGEVVKVLDFGLAKILAHGDQQGSDLTRVGTFIGTPEYAAPEVSQFGVADTRADVYSVGVLLYRMITGKVPFRGHTDAATIVMTVKDPVPPLPGALGLPRRLESLIYRCLEKEPERRFQSMEELLPALATCLVELGVESASLLAPSMIAASPVQLSPNRERLSPNISLRRATPRGVASPGGVRLRQLGVGAVLFTFGVFVAVGILQWQGRNGDLAGPPLSPVELIPAHDPVPLMPSEAGAASADAAADPLPSEHALTEGEGAAPGAAPDEVAIGPDAAGAVGAPPEEGPLSAAEDAPPTRDAQEVILPVNRPPEAEGAAADAPAPALRRPPETGRSKDVVAAPGGRSAATAKAPPPQRAPPEAARPAPPPLKDLDGALGRPDGKAAGLRAVPAPDTPADARDAPPADADPPAPEGEPALPILTFKPDPFAQD